MPSLEEAVSVFWDGLEDRAWDVEEFQEWLVEVGEQPRPVPTPGVPSGEFQPLWIRAWLLLFSRWAQAHGRTAAVVVRDNYGFVGELAEDRQPQVVPRLMGLLNGARQEQRELYEVEPGSPVVGFVATPEGIGFVWIGPPAVDLSFRWYRNSMEGAARTLWPREPHGRFFNMTGGKKIERAFWTAAPALADDAQAAVQHLLGYRQSRRPHGGPSDEEDDILLRVT